jgi:hyaluronate lyase
VHDGSASTNFGSATTLEVKATGTAGNNRITYLRFLLAGVDAHVSSARLRIFGSRPTASSVTDSVLAVSSNSWTETGTTWNNRPSLGARQGSGVVIGSTAQYYQWDVTAYVSAQRMTGATQVSFALNMDAQISNSPDTFNSKEASSNRPQLVVVSSP